MSERDADDAAGDSPSADDAESPEATEASGETGATETADHEDAVDAIDAVLENVSDVDPSAELVEYVEDADPDSLATRLAAFRTRIDALESQVDAREQNVEDLESRLARKQADFQNYKQRQAEQLEQEKQRATEDLVRRLLDVRDNLKRALEQDADADIRGGVESTLRQFDAELERENVTSIEPDPGDEVDPQRHEVLVRVQSEQPAGTIADVHRPGYEMAGKVLRAAQVTVSEADASETDEEAAGGDEPDDEADET